MGTASAARRLEKTEQKRCALSSFGSVVMICFQSHKWPGFRSVASPSVLTLADDYAKRVLNKWILY